VVPTKPIDGQKTGTSGLRKRTKVFTSDNYLANWVQSLFSALGGPDALRGKTLALGGDGRYFGREAAQIIIKLAAGNGFARVVVGRGAIMATPAMSALIRRRQLYGGLLMTASHNPGGPDADFGIKFNWSAGEPAPEKVTDKIYEETTRIGELRVGDVPDVDLDKVRREEGRERGEREREESERAPHRRVVFLPNHCTPPPPKPHTHPSPPKDGIVSFGGFSVEVVDPVSDYLDQLKEVFDFPALKRFVARKGFGLRFDALHAVTGPYARRIFVEELGAPADAIVNGVPLEDFGGGHPDPNLTYAHDLVEAMAAPGAPLLGAASDGDGDRNMVLGPKFFVSPSDSVAMIAAGAQAAIPYFKGGLKGVARSMPTGAALDRVAAKLGVPFFETPTGWKFFGNLMDAGKCSVCGEESFGTGADHVREKDGIFAVLAWLSLLEHANRGVADGAPLVSIEDICFKHWQEYGRNFFSRYDYEEVDSESANKVMKQVESVIASAKPGDKFGRFTLATADDFSYTDPIDGSVAKGQGLRFVFTDGSRIVFRLSGTGSSGATIRVYVEQYTDEASRLKEEASVALAEIIGVALGLSKLQELTGRDKPTVIT
jgi:phosphoglucomutase